MPHTARSDFVFAEQIPPSLACMQFVRKPPQDAEALVLAYIAAGLTDGEIGRILGMSIGKVRWAARSIIAKLGAANRPHAVTRAIAMGYLELVAEEIASPLAPD